MFQPGATTVRLIAVDCTDAEERATYRQYLFSIGTLSVGRKLQYIALPAGSFEFFRYHLTGINYDFGSRLELTFVEALNDPMTYQFTFEGRPDVIRPLWDAAQAQISLPPEKPRSQSGCLILLAIPAVVGILA